MKEIILCSDNHGKREPLKKLREMYGPQACYIHCGDSEMHPNELEGYASVQGNNDYFGAYPDQRILEIEGNHILVVHGHKDMIFGRFDMLAEKAKRLNCNIVMFGHTHIPFQKKINGIMLFNPGSLCYNRDCSGQTYMRILIENSKIEVFLKNI